MDMHISDLQAFSDFLSTQLVAGRSDLLPEDCLELWRAQNPQPSEFDASVESLRMSIDDMESGQLVDFDDGNSRIRAHFGWE